MHVDMLLKSVGYHILIWSWILQLQLHIFNLGGCRFTTFGFGRLCTAIARYVLVSPADYEHENVFFILFAAFFSTFNFAFQNILSCNLKAGEHFHIVGLLLLINKPK